MAACYLLRRMVFFLVLATGIATSTSALAQTKIYVDGTSKEQDQVGRQLIFELREALRRSSGLSLADRSNDARIHVRFVTLDPDANTSSSGIHTVYSMVITFRTFHEFPVNAYLTSIVGTCGKNRTESCAKSLLTDIDEQVTSIRSAILELRDSTPK